MRHNICKKKGKRKKDLEYSYTILNPSSQVVHTISPQLHTAVVMHDEPLNFQPFRSLRLSWIVMMAGLGSIPVGCLLLSWPQTVSEGRPRCTQHSTRIYGDSPTSSDISPTLSPTNARSPTRLSPTKAHNARSLKMTLKTEMSRSNSFPLNLLQVFHPAFITKNITLTIHLQALKH